MMPLLGGYNMKDFEGWQGRNDYDTYITNLYTHDLTTKFIQPYKIVKWVDGDPVTAGAATNWVPDMEITLKDNDGDTLVLTRGSNDFSSDAYRERTMTLNGKVIAQGAPSRGDRSDSDIQNGRNKRNRKLSASMDLGFREQVKKLQHPKKSCITGIQPEEQQHGKFRTDGRT